MFMFVDLNVKFYMRITTYNFNAMNAVIAIGLYLVNGETRAHRGDTLTYMS